VEARYARYRRMGEFATLTPSGVTRPERAGLAERIRQLLESGRAALAGQDGAPPWAASESDTDSDADSSPAAAPAETDEQPPLREEV
jgi:hypothetical protein